MNGILYDLATVAIVAFWAYTLWWAFTKQPIEDHRTPACPVCGSTPDDQGWRWDPSGHRWVRWTSMCDRAWQQVRDRKVVLR